jgi:HEAT repeat protein
MLVIAAALACGLTDHASLAQEAGTTVAGNDVSALVAQLKSDDPQVRGRAARALGELGPAAASSVDDLIAALKDSDSGVRRYAAQALGLLGDGSEKVLTALMKEIGDDQMINRLTAVTSLRTLATDPATIVPLAAKLLADEDQLLASRAVETLIVRGEKAVPFLKEALKNERAAYWACLAIEEMGPVAAETAGGLQNIVRTTKDEGLKVQAIIALARIGEAAAVAKDDLLNQLGEGVPESVQAAAAYAAGMLDFSEASGALKKNTNSKDKLVAMMSQWALARVHRDDPAQVNAAVDALVAGLSDDDAAIRLMAAEGLQELNLEPGVIAPKLAAVLIEEDPVVAHNIVEAFASLGEAATARAVAALDTETMRDLALRVLERLGPNAASGVPQLVAILENATGEYRERLQTVLGSIGPAAASATSELARSLTSDNQAVRVSAIIALGNIGPEAKAAVDPLKKLVQANGGKTEAVAAAWALANIAADDPATVAIAVPALIQGLSSADPMIQYESATTLGRLGQASADAIDTLKRLASSPDTDEAVKQAANEAVEKLTGK